MSGALAAAVVVLAGGALASNPLHAAGLQRGRLLLFTIALAPGIGCGFVSLVYFFALLFGLPPRHGGSAVLLLTAVLTVGTVLSWSRRRRAGGSGAQFPAGRASEPERFAAPVAALAWAAFATSLVVGGTAVWRLVHSWPEGTWDAVAIWNVRARFLYRGSADVASLLAQVEPSSHPHYPLLLPASIAAQYAIAGGESTWSSRLVAVSLLAGMVILAYAAAVETRSFAAGALAAALIAGSPLMWLWTAAQVSDVAVAYLFLATLVVLASQLPGYPAAPLPPVLGGLLLGLLAWAKDEGMVMAVIVTFLFAATLALVRRVGGWARVAPVGFWIAAGAIPGLLARAVFKRLWAPEGTGLETYIRGEWAQRLSDPERWWQPIEALAVRFLRLPGFSSDWSFLWLALGAVLAIAFVLYRGAPPAWLFFWMFSVAAVVASWVPVYAVTPYDQAWHIASSLDRLLLQVMPATAVGAVLSIVSAASSVSRPAPSRPDRWR